MRTITVLALLVIAAISPTAAGAATPGPSPSATVTGTPVATATPSVTASAVVTEATASPTATATPRPARASFTLSGRFAVDANGNGVEDGADTIPIVAGLNLIPWSTADALLSAETFDQFVDVTLYSAPDGSFVFENLPPDSYTLRMFWPFGFVTKGSSPAVPTILRAAFRVTDKGEIVAPDPLPKVWPGSLEPFVPDEPILGRIPELILLKKVENPNIVTVPVDDAGALGPPPVGRVDVSAVLQGRQRPAVQLPSTGSSASARDGWLEYLLASAAVVAAVAVAAVLVRRVRA